MPETAHKPDIPADPASCPDQPVFRQNLDLINSLLQKLRDDPNRAIRAYSLGAISMIAQFRGVVAPDSALKAASAICSLADLQQAIAHWEAEWAPARYEDAKEP